MKKIVCLLLISIIVLSACNSKENTKPKKDSYTEEAVKFTKYMANGQYSKIQDMYGISKDEKGVSDDKEEIKEYYDQIYSMVDEKDLENAKDEKLNYAIYETPYKKKQKVFTIVFKPNVENKFMDPGEPLLDGKYQKINLLVMGEGTYKRVNGNTEGKAIMKINERKHGLSEKLMSKISEDSKLVENKGIPKKDLKKLE
ncbi:hypothetical protein A7U35_06580 [Staphylococcus epidermidis]|uniref:Lipoprotein n=1 Tax=Staphylococcus epidermidis TaxID=1282 RepID=A0A1V0CTD5_STAEP|nr:MULTISPECIES: hypothetical protein [Staphylococcus]ARA73626.1 hypothetical protein [Staphylococcus epidermidis]KZG49401.1 hypothetical protein A4U44_00285 [Staphylococcus epidermidis]KZG55064.1 hypothetical protein A0W31_03970 [Staphylococcus epidermidis]KZG55357.1 hypothetical protein A0W30_06185 [Staphylococcus epidermidis]KZG55969.1 hypothetical protein A4R96_06010 [Staphylococcus epidermidis]